MESVTHKTVILQLKPRVQGRMKEERGLFLVTLFFVFVFLEDKGAFPKMLILLKTQC